MRMVVRQQVTYWPWRCERVLAISKLSESRCFYLFKTQLLLDHIRQRAVCKEFMRDSLKNQLTVIGLEWTEATMEYPV